METTQLSIFNRTIKTDDECIFVKPLCDFFQIDYDNQVVRIKNDAVLSSQTGKKPFETLFGDTRPRVCLTKKGFVRWIQLINPNTLPENLREKFMQYQTDIFDFFYGTAQEETEIRRLMGEQQRIDLQLKELAAKKRQLRKSLNSALYGRYQYQLEFTSVPPVAAVS
jgi:hypothetical protein